MDAQKLKRLEKSGWAVGTAEDFLKLSPEEVEIIELKLLLGKQVKQTRENAKLSQGELAKKMRSSQSRVAKIEAGDPSVSLDLIYRALFSSGATRSEISKQIISSEKNNKTPVCS
jgi:DNA-binding XRE family transcriptional regulator